MEQLGQELQFNQAKSKSEVVGKDKLSITIHNPNSEEQTAKYLAKLIIQGLKEKEYEDLL